MSARRNFPPPLVAMLLGLVLLIYGGNLFDLPLSDDELYLTRAALGPGELLRSVTTVSQPRMFRPLPALLWLLPAGAAKLPLLHLISLLLHAAAAALVARLAVQRGAPPPLGLLLGGLFAALPLLTEAILWLSASFDLWAACWALLALELGLAAGAAAGAAEKKRGLREGLAVLAFGLALLSKESVLTLPLLAPLLFGRAIGRRVIAGWAALIAGSLLLRLLLFGGLGGYSAGSGEPLPLRPLLLLRNLFVQTPFRVLQPFRELAAEPGAAGIALAAVMVLALALAAWGLGLDRRWREGWRSAPWRPPAALLVAALPLLAVYGLDPHHGNGRLLYFPAAVFTIALGGAVAPRPRWRAWTLPLVLFFLAAAMANAQVFRRAAAGKERLLELLAATEDRWPSGAVVQVDAPDTVLGAPVWRSAEGALRRAGLRRDLTFAIGHPGQLENPQGLGEKLFVVGPAKVGGLVDWTACERELRLRPPLPPAVPGEPAIAELRTASRPDTLLLYFWPPGGRPVPESAIYLLPRSEGWQRLRLPPGRTAPLEWRLDDGRSRPVPAELELLAAPEPCRRPLGIDSGADIRR